MSRALRLAVSGATGRMGAQVRALAAADARFSLAGGTDSRTPLSELAALLSRADVVVDFSAPAAVVRLARACANTGTPLVTGTTGLSEAQNAAVARAARRAPVFRAPNFSVAVHALKRLAARAAAWLPSYDAGVFEVHHKAKKDSPSGTALALAEGLGRRGVPVAAQRLGAVIGEHTVTLAGPFDRLELTHRAQSRAVFAGGALDAAAWLSRRRPGLYGMDDLLGR